MICLSGSVVPRGSSSSATRFPLLNTHTPSASSVNPPPHAANTRSFQANIAVISAGVWGRVIKVRLSPLRRSKVCRHLPTDVVIWKVVFPNGMEVKGTSVDETRPRVY